MTINKFKFAETFVACLYFHFYSSELNCLQQNVLAFFEFTVTKSLETVVNIHICYYPY